MRALIHELNENLTVATSYQNAQALHACIAGEEAFDTLVLHMTQVRRVDAAGVDLLVRLSGLLGRRGATLQLCQVRPHLRRTLSRLHDFTFVDERPMTTSRKAA